MVKIVFTPDWFLGKDIFIEAFSFIILFIFAILAIRYFKLNRKNRKFLYLGAGFGLIALAQLAAIFTKLVLYYDIGPSQQIGQAIVTTYHVVSSIDIFYYIGFSFQRLLTLIGLYVIYRLPRKKKSSWDMLLGIYFVLISALLGTSVYYLYHLTALFLLIMIVRNYSEIYKKTKFGNTKVLIVAFSILGLSQLIYIFSPIDALFVVANMVELISYGVLLMLIIRILQHGKKKNPHGYNIRYAGHNTRKRRRH